MLNLTPYLLFDGNDDKYGVHWFFQEQKKDKA
jgi:hypothetical protein